MNSRHVITLTLVCLLASCTSSKRYERQANAPQGFSQRLNQTQGYVRDKDGNWVPKSDKRSSFETQGDSPYFKDSLGTKTFDTTHYNKQQWSGKPTVSHKEFDTSTNRDFTSPDSGLGNQTALIPSESTLSQNNYKTGNVDTTAASENSGKRISKPSDAETDARRRVFQQPEIIDYQELRKFSVEDSRKMLGR